MFNDSSNTRYKGSYLYFTQSGELKEASTDHVSYALHYCMYNHFFLVHFCI